MSLITNVDAYMVLDSRGYPTVAVDVVLDDTHLGNAFVPSGASTGQYEAIELRDQDPNIYHGKGVSKPIENIRTIITKAILNKHFSTQALFDECLQSLDGSSNYKHLGANATLALSLAFARALAKKNNIPLYQSIGSNTEFQMPIPMLNVVNGGAHADNDLSIQEFMLVPHGFDRFSDAMRAGCEIYHQLRTYLQQLNLTTAVGDEGGFAPQLSSADQVLDILSSVSSKLGYQLGKEVSFALDIAASEFYKDGLYHYQNKSLQADELINVWQALESNYPIISIEDPLADDDLSAWQSLYKKMNQQCLLVGDDLLVTTHDRLSLGIEQQWMNSILIKPNQVGTLTQTLATIQLAKSHDMAFIISHRSGETEDAFIADLALATQAPLIKTGAPCRSERLAKYNRLLSVEHKQQYRLQTLDHHCLNYG